MLIGKKLNLLIIAVIAAIFIAIGVFAINYVPAVKMQSEKESLFALDSAISELRAEINKLAATSFDSQVEIIQEKSEMLRQKFLELDTFSYLKADPEISESLEVISRLYALYESNYERLMKTVSDLTPNLNEVFLSDAVKIDDVINSVMLDRFGDKKAITALVVNLKSVISILDSNLSSTHMVVMEQYAIINSLITARERQSYIFGLLILLIMSAVVLIAAVFVAARISSNIQEAGKGIQTMSEGDISRSFNINSKDEISELGKNLNILTDSLKQVFKSMKNSSNKGVELKEELIASANQTSAAAAEIAANSRAISDQFAMLSERVEGASEANVSMKQSIRSLEEFVQEQTAMVEESTSSVTEMISSINNVAEITARKQQATVELVKTADEGGKKLSATIGVINEINNSLDQIRGTATIIQQIASQTNLLAMNAAIEAAHAGEAGRGFAVVADEIRKLAEASSLNSKQISGVLKEIVSKIESASASGHETETAFVEIDKEVEGVAQSFDEISASMDELNIGGRQILEAMTSLQDVSQQVNQGSDNMAVSSEKVTEAIEVVSRITTEVSNSANEITSGINEVSSAMAAVTELSNSLGDITDRLEKESLRFRTEAGDSAGEQYSPENPVVLNLNEGGTGEAEMPVSDVTISEDNETPVTIESVPEEK